MQDNKRQIDKLIAQKKYNSEKQKDQQLHSDRMPVFQH